MRAIGIDPGIETVGYAIVEETNENTSLVDFGCIITPRHLTTAERLLIIQQDLLELIKKYNPAIAGVESIFFQNNAKTVISVAQARGVILSTLQNSNITIIEPTPLQVKMQITGDGKADKIQVQTMLKRIFSLDALPKPDDAADAIAIALYALSQHQFDLQTQKI